jgi:hypothetical protein
MRIKPGAQGRIRGDIGDTTDAELSAVLAEEGAGIGDRREQAVQPLDAIAKDRRNLVDQAGMARP